MNTNPEAIDPLAAEGWERKFIANEPRLSEAVALYQEIGFEVRLEPLPKKGKCSACAGAQGQEEGECRVCFEGVEDQYKIIYIRPLKGRLKTKDGFF